MTRLIYDSLGDIEQSFAILDLVPDTHAWVKDIEGLFVLGNRLFCERFGFESLVALAGKTDFDLAPPDMARRYRADDDRALKGGSVGDRLELIGGERASVEWFLTSKWPVYQTTGEIIGSFGISRHLNKTEVTTVPYRELSTPIQYIQAHFAAALSVDEIASACNLSVSALERRFKKYLGKTPHQYIVEVRLEHARRLLLETVKPVGVIALETGFADHSHFTRAFSKHFGSAPSVLRGRAQSGRTSTRRLRNQTLSK